MKLEEAIERNVELKGELVREGRLEKAKAVQLGIEALKDYQKLKLTTFLPIGYKLPSETPPESLLPQLAAAIMEIEKQERTK